LKLFYRRPDQFTVRLNVPFVLNPAENMLLRLLSSVPPTWPAIMSIARDIAERKAAEEAMRQSESRFRAVVESAPDAIFIQTQGRFAYLNPAALRLFGEDDPQSLLGQSVVDRFRPDYRNLILDCMRRLNTEKMSVSALVESIQRRDGTFIEVEVSAVPFSYLGQSGALVFARDVMDRKQSEDLIRKLSRAVEQSPASIIITDTAGSIEYVNPKFSDVTGYSFE
jgi:two-component system, cell cycle sensor histidine kinase and response regulator CckA